MRNPSGPPGADIPDELDRGVLERAVNQAREALSDEKKAGVIQRLVAYYAVGGNYAGASFATLAPVEPMMITATDLHATTLLSVDIGPGATRRLLAPSPDRDRALEALRNVPDTDLAAADAATLRLMEDVYRWVKETLSSPTAKDPNPWVTASKLCARKRPRLFPVRDRNVCDYLGILSLNDFRKDWLVFRHLMRNPDLMQVLNQLPGRVRAAAREREVVLDDSPLRLLDAALWTCTVWPD